MHHSSLTLAGKLWADVSVDGFVHNRRISLSVAGDSVPVIVTACRSSNSILIIAGLTSTLDGQKRNDHLLDEMTRVNNELVNTHRNLVKSNLDVHYLNASMNEAMNDLEVFAYGASHDLKEPLRMITSFMTLL